MHLHLKEQLHRREEVARSINQVMERFPLILEILEELSRSHAPGDEEIRHGCQRAITAMLGALAQINPSEPSSTPMGKEEAAAKTWLAGRMPHSLIDPDQLACFDSFIECLLPS